MTDDRFTRGFLAGLTGGIIMTSLNLMSFYLLHFAKNRYLDFAATIMFGHKPQHLVETISAQAIQIGFAAVLGAVFVLLIPVLTSKNLLLKSWIFGVSSWFIIYVLGALYKVPLLRTTPWQTIISSIIDGSAFGLVIGAMLIWFERRTITHPSSS